MSISNVAAGGDPSGLALWQAIAIFGGIPVSVLAVITALTLAATRGKPSRPSPRPTLETTDPEVGNDPETPESSHEGHLTPGQRQIQQECGPDVDHPQPGDRP